MSNKPLSDPFIKALTRLCLLERTSATDPFNKEIQEERIKAYNLVVELRNENKTSDERE